MRLRSTALALLLCASATSCGLVPEHPGDENIVLGFRAADRTVEVKVPLCPADQVSRVEVWDPGSETTKERMLWWGEEPTGEAAKTGLLRLWSPVGYQRASTVQKPAVLPPSVDVSVTYTGQEQDSVGDLVNLDEVARHHSTGEFWTIKETSMSAQEIDGQLSCDR